MMEEIRQAIIDDTFLAYYREKREAWSRGDEAHPMNPPKRRTPGGDKV
jgi:hypothetical protein